MYIYSGPKGKASGAVGASSEDDEDEEEAQLIVGDVEGGEEQDYDEDLEEEAPNVSYDKTGVVNDPLGQPTVPIGSDFCMILRFWD